jgi:hypothetical protein
MSRVHGRVLATPIILILFLRLRPVCGGFVYLFLSACRALVPSDFGLCGSYRIWGLGSSGHRQEHDVPIGIGASAAAPPPVMNRSAASSSSSSTVATSPFIAGSSADVGSSLVAPSPSLVATSSSPAGPPPPLPPPPQAPPQPAKPLARVFGGRSFVQWLTGLPPDRLEEVTESLAAFQVAEAEWRESDKDHERATLQLGVSKKRAAFKVNYKRAVGIRFLAWRAAAGKDSKSEHKELSALRPASLKKRFRLRPVSSRCHTTWHIRP